MREAFDWRWVEGQVARSAQAWFDCAGRSSLDGPRYSASEQQQRELAYDEELGTVEQEARRRPVTRAGQLAAEQRMTASFARFAATALDLEDGAVHLLTDDFLPAGTRLARWARQFDESLSMAEIIQADRNAWTACGLQALLGEPVGLTPSILGYSLLYPYTDNYLDRTDVSGEQKRSCGERFRQRLAGGGLAADPDSDSNFEDDKASREDRLWALVELIEGQYGRPEYPQVYDCLLAIHRAQEASVGQQQGSVMADPEVVRISCAKGGTSVLADACLVRGWLGVEESEFAFDWGVLLQLGDDLQDVREDLERGSVTLFSREAASGRPLDALAEQLLCLSDRTSARMDALPQGSPVLKNLLRMSWRSLIVGAAAGLPEFFTPDYLAKIEPTSPFRFGFLRARRTLLASLDGLYARVFEAFLAVPEQEDGASEVATPAAAAF